MMRFAIPKWLLALSFLALFSTSASPTTQLEQETLCDAAARQISLEENVPLSVLRALTRTETGRSRNGATQPWAWTVNMEGTGVWFETQTQARAYVLKHFKRGARSFDIGCFQINYKWHSHAFSSIEEMFDPITNARYAATFIKSLYAQTNDWTTAAGQYHSKTKIHADRYIARYAAIYDAGERRHIKEKNDNVIVLNEFPLLPRVRSPSGLGSLMPLRQGNRSSLFRAATSLSGS